jgi:hypothetical protein
MARPLRIERQAVTNGYESFLRRTALGISTQPSTLSASYSANNLNQYTSRTVPTAVDVIGSASNAATVTVNGQSTYRRNDYYRL